MLEALARLNVSPEELMAPAPAPWGAPDLSLLRNEQAPAPTIPQHVLPPFFARWVADAAEGAGAPQAFVAGALLATAGAVIGNARWVSPWPSWRHPPAINVALVGPPSSGKSPALAACTALLARIEADDNADWAERKRDGERAALEAAERRKLYEADVKAAVKEGATPPLMPEGAMPPEPAQRRRLYTADATTEKAARLSAANPRGMLLHRDELAGWLGSMDRYTSAAGGDRAFWLEGHNGGPFVVDRVRDGADGVAVPHLTWGVIGGIQPDRLRTLLLAGDDDGLAARFMPIWPDRVSPQRPRAFADNEGAYRALRRLRDLPWPEAPEPRLVLVAEAALPQLDAWRCEVGKLEDAASGLMVGWLGKLPGLALRLALTLEMLAWAEGPDDAPEPACVSERALVAAITLLADFALPMARRAFGAVALPEAERDARRLAQWLARQRPIPEVVNARALRLTADGPGIPDASRIEAALAELATADWLRAAPGREGGPGRQRKDWAVSPLLAETLP